MKYFNLLISKLISKYMDDSLLGYICVWHECHMQEMSKAGKD